MTSPEVKPPLDPLPRHDIVLGVPFKPFEGISEFGQYEQEEGIFANVPESYKHKLYLRRKVSLSGIDGRIDVISDERLGWFFSTTRIDTGYKSLIDLPFGNGSNAIPKDKVILRFSFLLKNPSDYAKLLSLSAIINIGEDKFLLDFSINKKKMQKHLDILSNGEASLVSEKNLFSIKTLDDLEEKMKEESDDSKSKKDEKEMPDRISFVMMPVDLVKLKTISMLFEADDWSPSEALPIPDDPQKEPVPVAA